MESCKSGIFVGNYFIEIINIMILIIYRYWMIRAILFDWQWNCMCGKFYFVILQYLALFKDAYNLYKFSISKLGKILDAVLVLLLYCNSLKRTVDNCFVEIINIMIFSICRYWLISGIFLIDSGIICIRNFISLLRNF